MLQESRAAGPVPKPWGVGGGQGSRSGLPQPLCAAVASSLGVLIPQGSWRPSPWFCLQNHTDSVLCDRGQHPCAFWPPCLHQSSRGGAGGKEGVPSSPPCCFVWVRGFWVPWTEHLCEVMDKDVGVVCRSTERGMCVGEGGKKVGGLLMGLPSSSVL